MRKLSAFILLFPVAFLFLGTVRIGTICGTPPAVQCAKMKAADRCGSRSCGSGGCHKGKDQSNKKDGCPCCLECPMCTLVTFSPEFRLEVVRHEKMTEYAVMPDNPLSDYFQQHWKPPDPTLLS